MKTKDLKTGMKIHFEDGTVGHVLLGTANGDIVAGEYYFPLSNYTLDLAYWIDAHTVSKVTQPKENAYFLSSHLNNDTIIWELEPTKKPTWIKKRRAYKRYNKLKRYEEAALRMAIEKNYNKDYVEESWLRLYNGIVI
jgi:hypothetical protein